MIRIVIEFAISLLDSSMIIFRRPLTLWSVTRAAPYCELIATSSQRADRPDGEERNREKRQRRMPAHSGSGVKRAYWVGAAPSGSLGQARSFAPLFDPIPNSAEARSQAGRQSVRHSPWHLNSWPRSPILPPHSGHTQFRMPEITSALDLTVANLMTDIKHLLQTSSIPPELLNAFLLPKFVRSLSVSAGRFLESQGRPTQRGRRVKVAGLLGTPGICQTAGIRS